MKARTLLLLALGLFMFIAFVIARAGQRTATDASLPTAPSTYLASPDGALGLVEALQRMGVRVERWRRSYRLLAEADTVRPAPLLVVLGPTFPLGPDEARDLLARVRTRGPVLVAGPGAAAAMECYGWTVIRRGDDSIGVRVVNAPTTPRAGWVRWVLTRAAPDTGRPDMERRYAGIDKGPCRGPRGEVDTLLETTGRRPVLLRLSSATGHPMYLLSDPGLLSNRVLRSSDAGPWLLRFLAGAGPELRFDEYHHGYDEGGDLFTAVLAWSGRSAWGWSAWQLAVVGLLALIAAMPRTGPIRQAIRRARRSSLEHVRALATALRAARGHDIAVELLIRGLRRRLSHDGRATREPSARWLAQLQDRVRTPRARAAAERLGALTRPGRSADDVLAAANAVEDVWQELRP